MIIRTKQEQTIIFEKHEAPQAVMLTEIYKKQGFVIRESGSMGNGKEFYLMRKTETNATEETKNQKKLKESNTELERAYFVALTDCEYFEEVIAKNKKSIVNTQKKLKRSNKQLNEIKKERFEQELKTLEALAEVQKVASN